MTFRSTARFTTSLSVLALAMITAPALAADAAAADEEIVVTAQKRAQNLLSVPLAVQAISGKSLERSGRKELNDIISSIPGASSVSRSAPGFETIQIRGIASGTTGDATVGYYIDDVPFSIPNLQLAPPARLFDLERVEVLRGPQGTLYGQGAMGGTIRLVTTSPNLTEIQVRGQLEASGTSGGKGNYSGDGVVNIPIVRDKVALRVSGGYEKLGGFVDSPQLGLKDINDSRSWNVRGKLRVQPSDNATFDFTVWHVDNSLDYRNTIDQVDPPLVNTLSKDGRPNFIDSRMTLYSGLANIDLGPFDVVSSTSYIDHVLDFDASFLANGILRNKSIFATESFTQEIRFVSKPDQPFTWLFGGYYQTAEIKSDICLSVFLPCTVPFSININSAGSIKTSTVAVFGEGAYSFLDDRLKLTVGARYFSDDRRTSGLNRLTNNFAQQGGVFRTFNPRFNLAFKATDDILLYGNIAKGFRSGAFQTEGQANSAIALGIPTSTAVDPDSVWSYEVGAKGRIFGDTLTFDTNLYLIDWKDIQLQFNINGVATLSNGGNARSKGIDLGLAWKTPLTGLTLNFVGNYNSAEFTKVLPAIVVLNPLAAPGSRIPGVPESSVMVSADWSIPINDGLTGTLNASYSYRDLILDPTGLKSDTVEEVNLRAGLDFGKFQFQVFADNLLNNRVAVVRGTLGVQPNLPRRIGGRFSFAF